MLLKKLLLEGKNRLKSLNPSHNLIDAEIILMNILNFKDRIDLIKNYDIEINLSTELDFFEKINFLIYGKPIDYIINKKLFYNSKFEVNQYSLIPREDSEILINKALEIFNNQEKFINIVDFGSGTGCLGLSFLKNYKNSRGFLVEKNKFACEIIRKNTKNLDLFNRVNIINSDWNNKNLFKNIKFDLIISNPPYINIRKKAYLMKSVLFFEPNYALFDKNQENFYLESTYQQILSIAERILKKNGYIVFEIDEKRQPIHIDKKKFFKVAQYNDIYNNPRCLILRKSN